MLGLGNRLRRDEGLGVCALERLYQRYVLPSGVQLVDGGVLGLELLAYVESARRLLVLDAALTEGEPGSLLRLKDDEVPAYFGVRASPHEIGLPDLLAAARLRGRSPESIVLLGMQPETIELGWGLTPVVASRLDHLIEAAVDQLASWGYAPHARSLPDATQAGEESTHA